jgi:hypothetical protein
MRLPRTKSGPTPADAAGAEPARIDYRPARPYRVLYADLPFYSDPKGLIEVPEARLAVLRCEDPGQTQQTIECMPVRKRYRPGQVVAWDLNNKKMWETAYYRDPQTGEIERAWVQAVEFTGPVVDVAEGEGGAEAPTGRSLRNRS